MVGDVERLPASLIRIQRSPDTEFSHDVLRAVVRERVPSLPRTWKGASLTFAFNSCKEAEVDADSLGKTIGIAIRDVTRLPLAVNIQS